MNKKKVIVLSGLMILFLSLSSFKSGFDLNENINKAEYQEGFIVYATFDGKNDSGYNFVATGKNGKAQTLTFQKTNNTVLTTFNLNTTTFVGSKFKVTFSSDVKTKTITNLEKL